MSPGAAPPHSELAALLSRRVMTASSVAFFYKLIGYPHPLTVPDISICLGYP